MRLPRCHFLALLLALLTLLLGLLLLGELAGWPWLARPLEQRLTQALQRPVTLLPAAGGRLRLQLFGAGPRLEAGRLRIADRREPGDARPEGPAFAEIEALRLQLRWTDLLRLAQARWQGRPGELVVDELQAQGLRLHARRDAAGRVNWEFPGPAGEATPAQPIRLRRLQLQRVEGSLDDQLQRLHLSFQLRMDEAQAPALQGQAQGLWRGERFAAQLQADSPLPLLEPEKRPRIALRLQLEAEALSLGFEGEAADLLAQRGLRGQLRAKGRSLAGLGRLLELTLPNTPRFSLQAELAHGLDGPLGLWQIGVQQARVGGSELAGRLKFDARPLAQAGGRGLLSGQLHARSMRLADLGPAVGTDAPQQPGSRLLPRHEFDLPALRAMDAELRFAIDRFELGATLRPMRPLNARLRLHDGLLRLEELEAGLAQGRFRGLIELDARQAGPARWRTALQIDRMRLEQWLPASQQPPWASGSLSAVLNLRGQGRSSAELLASADGEAGLLWSGGRLSHLAVELLGLDMAEGLGRWLGGDEALPVRCGAARLRIRDGLLRPAPAVVDTTDSTLWAEGQLSLADERLDLRLQVAPKDASLLSLRTPLRLRGSLARPAPGLEGGPLAGRLLPSVALGLANPLAALLPLLDLGERDEAAAAARACQQAAQRLAPRVRGQARSEGI